MSRHEAVRRRQGHDVVDHLAERGYPIRSPFFRGAAEEAPDAYKDVSAIVEVADRAGLARKLATLAPSICVKEGCDG